MDSLIIFYQDLTRTLIESGLSGAQLNETLSHCLRIECVRCRIQVSAEDLERLTLSDAQGEALHPKLRRLRLGYCAREGCESFFYEAHLENDPKVDWESAARRAEALIAASKETAAQNRGQPKSRNLSMRTLLALLVLTILLWLMHSIPPSARKPHKYEIDPASSGAVLRH